MPGFATLTDNFDDNSRDLVKWSGSYGDVVESGGRARVPCTTAFSAYQSASAYTLDESQVGCQVFAPAMGGATVEALAEVLVITSVGGTDGGFSINTVTGQISCVSRTGYFDGSAVVLAYSATTHAWLRLRESAGVLHWDTSPDGAAWTTRRSSVSPAWVNHVNLSVVMAGHRNNGTADFAEFDNFNIARAGGLSVSVRSAAGLSPYARTGPTLSGG
ncbi:hypothetical protein NLX86_18805 [Streptomyces sp. A3M-1-3]|uniref:hypothetical protein n=1 Tax=Streptomyces sp. A3M-1-3 TaxID=2962044 RepID=UPI0020B64986|nr:hypothetical protein [Streptomyces sp. A3M-1-3]MCP3820068.1 hypothetical protein [Streptomyces sp. A3M-1-3]